MFQIGQCKTLHVLSLRENELCELPEEVGHLPRLKVLDIISNRIKCVPLSFSNLDLDAFWVDGSQVIMTSSGEAESLNTGMAARDSI